MSITKYTPDIVDVSWPPTVASSSARLQKGGAAPVAPKVIVIINTSYGDSEAILNGILQYQREHGVWDVFVDYEGLAESDPEWLSQQPWRGVISRTTTQRLVDQCAAQKIPLSDLNDCTPFAGVPKVRPDNIAVGHMAAEDLYEKGFRHFYYCGYPNRDWSLDRRDGYFEALRLLGCHAEEFSLPFGCGLTPAEYAGVVAQMTNWLKTIPRPAAIMAAHDLRGRQILEAAQHLGIIVPEELAVIGVNNDEVRCELAFPTLSSVAIDHQRAAYLAAEQLALLMAGGSEAARDIRVEPIRIVTRNSTDSLAIEDRAISAALSIVRQEACRGITVDEIVRRATIPRARLERGFRTFLGRSPQAEIRRIQLLNIKQLLIETDLPLKQIAQLTGFEHVEYLSVTFKRIVGETPGRFRRAARDSSGSGPCKSIREGALISPAA
jgi:LacI family transcriptional regulator